jgi:hypothetical protein
VRSEATGGTVLRRMGTQEHFARGILVSMSVHDGQNACFGMLALVASGTQDFSRGLLYRQ